MKKFCFRVQSIIFDLDGVITNTMSYHYKAWRVVMKEHGIPVSYEDIYSREGQPGLHSVFELFKKYQKTCSMSQLKRILHQKEAYFKTIVKQKFIRGARTLLKSLKEDQFRLALVTGTSRHEVHKILPAHIIDLFSVIITGSDVKHGKPHPEPYLKSLENLGHAAKHGIVIENAPFGIESAKRAGLRCLALETSLPRSYLSQADIVVRSIDELNKYVRFKLVNSNGR